MRTEKNEGGRRAKGRLADGDDFGCVHVNDVEIFALLLHEELLVELLDEVHLPVPVQQVLECLERLWKRPHACAS